VISRINVGGDESGSFRVGPGNDEIGGSHDITLESHGDESVDVFRYGY